MVDNCADPNCLICVAVKQSFEVLDSAEAERIYTVRTGTKERILALADRHLRQSVMLGRSDTEIKQAAQDWAFLQEALKD